MRVNAIRVVMLIGLSICTAITSHFAAPNHSRARAAVDERPQGSTLHLESKVVIGGVADIPVVAPAENANVLLSSRQTIQPLGISVDGAAAVIATRADIMERNPSLKFLWSIEIFNRRDRSVAVSELYYDRQLFQMPEGQFEMQPTFSERFELAPGAYIARVRLYGIRPSIPIPDFAKGEKISGVRPLGAEADFDIGF